MKHTDLINELAADLGPIKRLNIGIKEVAITFGIALLAIAAVFFGFGFRADISAAFVRWNFALETISLLVLALLATVVSLMLSIPGRDHKKITWFTIGLLGLWLLTLIYQFIQTPASGMGTGVTCIKSIILVSLLPTLAIFWFIRRGAPLKRPLAGLAALFAGASYGAFATQFICSNDAPLHLLTWHALTMSALTLTGLFLGKFIFKKL